MQVSCKIERNSSVKTSININTSHISQAKRPEVSSKIMLCETSVTVHNISISCTDNSRIIINAAHLSHVMNRMESARTK